VADIQDIYDLLLQEGYQEELFRDLAGKKVRKEKGGRETLVDCPFCDKEGHFSYHRDKPVWQCWSCGKAGDWITYLKLRRGWDFLESLHFLAERAGVQISQESQEQAQKRARKGELLDVAQGLFAHGLTHLPGLTVREYLAQRGYSSEEVALMAREGLGAYVDRENLEKALLHEGYSEEEIRESGLLATGFGEDYTLSILWRDRVGKPLGFVMRSLLPEQELKAKGLPKYKNTPGLQKDEGLIGYSQARGEERLLIVEGVLDAYILQTKGLPAVALGGTSLSREMLQSMERSHTKELVLALDIDSAGQKATDGVLADVLGSRLRAYVATMPAGYKDPDELIRQEGLQALQDVLRQAESGARWRARYLLSRHDVSTDSGRDRALDEALQALADIQDGLGRRDFRETLGSCLGLSEQDLAQRIAEAESKAKKQAQERALAGLWEDLGRDLARQDSPKALERIASGLKGIRDGSGELSLPAPYPAERMVEELLQTPKGLRTGYSKLDELMTISPGAITIVAGRPGHGKTTMLLNLAVNMLQATSKSFYLFSYEEARKFLALKMILILAEQALHKKQNQEAYINYLRDKRGTNEAIEEAIQRYEIWISEGRLILSDEALPGDRLAKTIGRIAQAGNVGAIFVDYIQRIPWSGEGRRQLARYEEIKAVSALLLEQAVTTDIPIILGAQLGRGQGQGDKKKIRLDNLRESGDIENDANTVIGIFNESVAQMEEDGQEVDSPTVPLEVHLLKRRGGQAGKKVVLQFDRPILKIKDGSGKEWN